MSQRSTAIAAAAASLLLTLLAAPPPAAAHELGLFQVFGTFAHDGTYRLDVRVDEEHLPGDRQGGPAHLTRYGPIRGLDRQTEQVFGRFLSDLADSLTLRFDGRPVTPHLMLDPPDPDNAGIARATLRVEGWIPGGARTFTLESSLPGKSYPLVLNNEGDELSIWKWVDPGAVSPPFPLAAAVVPAPAAAVARRFAARGAADVLPHGPAALLLLAALFLLARRPFAALPQVAALAAAQALGLALALSGAVAARPEWTAPLLALATACLALVALAPRTLFDRRPAAHLLSPAAPAAALAVPAARLALPRFSPAARLALPLAALPLGVLLGLAEAPAFPSAAAPARSGLAGVAPPWLGPAVASYAGGALAAELAVTAAVLLLIGLPFAARPWYRGRVVVPAGCLIAVVGVYRCLAAWL